MQNYDTICLIVAAGVSERIGGDVPKQYLPINGTPMLRYSILAFLNHPNINAVRVVYNPEHKEFYEQATDGLDILDPIPGGKIRKDSVRFGLVSIEEYNPKRVLIHDGARPLVSENIITRVLDGIDKYKSAIPAVAVEDTLKKCSNNKIEHTVNRSDIYRAQTPQGFLYRDILTAHNKLGDEILTDDASINEHLNLPVHIVEGSQLNFKVTTKEDLNRAARLIGEEMNTETRSGIGYDVHAFDEPNNDNDNFVTLCGVEIPHDKPLKGHSDSDAGIHAIVDAILGAISTRTEHDRSDIGDFFPPSDDQYKGVSSSLFLEKARDLVKEQNARIINIDVTLICEAPKITPHKSAMAKRLSEILEIEESRISIKATTTEKLGFTGRGEGIAAQAIANVEI